MASLYKVVGEGLPEEQHLNKDLNNEKKVNEEMQETSIPGKEKRVKL